MAQQPLEDQGLFIIEASRSHPVRHTTLGSTPLDEWSARRRDLYLTTQHSQETYIHAPGGIRNHNPSKRAATDPRHRSRGHSGRLQEYYFYKLWCTLQVVRFVSFVQKILAYRLPHRSYSPSLRLRVYCCISSTTHMSPARRSLHRLWPQKVRKR